MNWLMLVLSFFMPIVQQEIHQVQQQRYQQQQTQQRPLYQVNGRWYTYANGEWYIWTTAGWVLNIPPRSDAMKETFDVVFHTNDGHVRCGPFINYARAQEFIMGVDPDAFSYETVEIVKEGEPVNVLLAFRPAS